MAKMQKTNISKDKIQEFEKITSKIINSDNEELKKELQKIQTILRSEVEQQTEELKNILLERKKVEQQLILFSRAADQSSSTVVITDTNGIIEYVNKKFTETTGYTFDEVIGKNPRILNSGEKSKEFYSEMWQTILNGKDWSGEFHNRGKNGELYWEWARIAPVRNNDGIITNFIAIKDDITQKKKNEEKINKYLIELEEKETQLKKEALEKDKLLQKLQESENKLKEEVAAKDKLFSIISHDLRSPFTALLGHSRMINESYEEFTEEEIRESINSIQKTSENLFTLLEDLLEWSRAQRGTISFNPKIISIKSITDRVLSINTSLLENKQIEATINVPDIEINLDEDITFGIIRNLFSNAIKFTRKRGKILIEYSEDENFHYIAVKDNGIGIHEADIKKLLRLDIIHTTLGTENERGTGLGLLLCKELAEKQGGTLSVESQLGHGSTFTFSIPKNLNN